MFGSRSSPEGMGGLVVSGFGRGRGRLGGWGGRCWSVLVGKAVGAGGGGGASGTSFGAVGGGLLVTRFVVVRGTGFLGGSAGLLVDELACGSGGCVTVGGFLSCAPVLVSGVTDLVSWLPTAGEVTTIAASSSFPHWRSAFVAVEVRLR